MNNFPIEPPTDLFGSGFIGSCNGLFESPLSFISDMPLIHEFEPHMVYYSGEMQNQINTTSYGISAGSTCEPAMNVGSQVEVSVSDFGTSDLVDKNSPAIVMNAAVVDVDNSGTGNVETIDNSVNAGSMDVSTESIVNTDASVDVDNSGSAELLGSQNAATCNVENGTETSENNDEPVIDISISNVVCAFNTKCYLSLKKIAHDGMNVEYKKATGTVLMKLRKPMVTANIWASGKVTCTGSRSEDESRVAARRVARCLQKIYKNARFCEFRVVNVLGACSLPFGIRITEFSRCYPKEASYEPELHPGVTYRITSPKATLKIFSTGSITVTAPCVSNVQRAVEHIYPLVVKFRMGKCKEALLEAHSSDFKQPSSYFQQFQSPLKRSDEWSRKAKNPLLDDENSDDSESDEMSNSEGR